MAGVLERGGDADDVLREVVAILHERLGRFVRISFVETDGLPELVVLDEQMCSLPPGCGASAGGEPESARSYVAGSVTANRLPRPSSLSTAIRPPESSTIP